MRRREVLDETLRRVLEAMAARSGAASREAPELPRRRLRRGLPARRAQLSEAEIERLAAALSRIYEREPGLEAPPHPGYDAARRRFHEHAVRLLEQLAFGEALADETLPPLPEPTAARGLVQQEIRLEAPPRGMAAGRFLVTNEGDEPLPVHFEPGSLHATAEARRPAPCFEAPVRFDPEAPVLAPAGTESVRILVDLAGAAVASGQDLELAVDVRGRDALLARVWVAIAVHGQRAGPEAP